MFQMVAALLLLLVLEMVRRANGWARQPAPVAQHLRRQGTAIAAMAVALSLPCLLVAQDGVTSPGTHEVSNQQPGKVIDLPRNGEASLVPSSSQDIDGQIAEMRATSNRPYSFQSVLNRTPIDAVGGSNNPQVRATRPDGRTSQQWPFDTGKGGNAPLLAIGNNAMNTADGSTSDGERVQILSTTGATNQQFRFLRVDASFNEVADQRTSSGGTRTPAAQVAPSSASAASLRNRTSLKPGWNMFSAAQDVELGQQASQEVAQQVLMLNDARVDRYLTALGQRLTVNAPGFEVPYTFKAVNDKSINAFALPGGPIFINRGVIEAADTESQLAGVMAHEASHVALRHGTNQASKASAAQMPLAILGGLLGADSTGAALAQLGAGFTVNSILLKYSRDAESQADLMATQMLYDAGFEPKGMSEFFQKLGGSNGTAFFNSHPTPENRVERVNEEVLRLGTPLRKSQASSNEFTQIKRYVQSLPAPRPNQLALQQQENAPSQTQGSSERFVTYQNSMLSIQYPDNWQTYGQADAVTIAPRGGLVSDGTGSQAMVYGLLVNIYEPHQQTYGQSLRGGQSASPSGSISLQMATDQLIQELRQSNRNLRVVRRSDQIDLGGQRGLSTYLSNDSPAQGGGRETNWLVTVPRPEGLLFLVFTAPEREFQHFENVYQQMLYSVRVK